MDFQMFTKLIKLKNKKGKQNLLFNKNKYIKRSSLSRRIILEIEHILI